VRVLALARARRVVCPSGQQSQQEERKAERCARDGYRATSGPVEYIAAEL